MQQYAEGITKNFTVGDLKRLLNKFPEDTIICRKRLNIHLKEDYSSVQSLTYMRNQDFVDFIGEIKEGNILTII